MTGDFEHERGYFQAAQQEREAVLRRAGPLRAALRSIARNTNDPIAKEMAEKALAADDESQKV